MMKLTKIAVALVAVLAMSAFVASAASAAQIKSSSSPVMLFGEDTGTHVFKVDGQAVTCNKAVFEKASLATPANEVTGVTAAYNECTAFGFAGATINMGNCTYTFKPLGEEVEAMKWKENLAVACSGAANININSSVFGSECSVSVGSGGNNGNITHQTVTYNTSGNIRKIENKTTASNITATKNKDNGLCPLSGTGTINNATYEGTTIVEGTAGVEVWVE